MMSARPVRMTRRVSFSSGHRYWLSNRTEDENRALFGRWASPFNHGHNYILDVTVSGHVDPVTGMIVNIKRVDELLRSAVISEFDQRSINDEIPFFRDQASTLENLSLYLVRRLESVLGALQQIRLAHLRLEESPRLWAEFSLADKKMILTRSFEFAASHRLNVASLSPSENLALFGKCNNSAGHGHNYVLEVSVSGEPDPDTGMMVDLTVLDELIHSLVVDRYDHKNLNEDIPEFRGVATTSEVVATKIFDTLNGKLPAKLEKVRLFETPRNAFEVSA